MTEVDEDAMPETLFEFTQRMNHEWVAYRRHRAKKYGTMEFALGDGDTVELVGSAVAVAVAAGKLADQPPASAITLGEIPKAGEDTIANLSYLTLTWEMAVRHRENVQGFQVKRLRQLRVAWQRIGSALGMTAQSAHQKAKDKGWITGDDPAVQ